VIGGGSGRFTLLEGLRRTPTDITAIVTMADSGGSSGRLRSELGVLPPGDVRQCLVALSTSPKLMLDLFNYRFAEGSLSGHNFGNLFLTALEKTTGSFERAVEEAGRILSIEGRVIPSTLDRSDLFAELEDGTIVEGETNIDIPENDGRAKIRRVYLQPKASATPKALEGILDADIVVLGPGDLFTSIIPNVLVGGMAEALKKTRGRKVFVLPLATKRGETDGYSAGDFVEQIKRYCGCEMDYVISNTARFSEGVGRAYSKDGAQQVTCGRGRLGKAETIAADLLMEVEGLARHDPIRTAQAVLSCLEKNASGKR
jgi:uncharacterized cofD-like protein